MFPRVLGRIGLTRLSVQIVKVMKSIAVTNVFATDLCVVNATLLLANVGIRMAETKDRALFELTAACWTKRKNGVGSLGKTAGSCYCLGGAMKTRAFSESVGAAA